jgi:hypothetical protein
MIHFPRLRTTRLDVQVRELSTKEAVALLATPIGKHEIATTAMLRYVVDEAAGAVPDPRAWTVQERMLVMAHYLSCVSTQGSDFPVGEGRASDYITPSIDTAPPDIELGEVGGNAWLLRQVNGAEAEAIEAVADGALGWMVADMAARLRVIGDEKDAAAPDAIASPGPYTDWLRERVEVFLGMPQSEFEALAAQCDLARAALDHIVILGTDDAGYIALPANGGGTNAVPARFPVASCISDFARRFGPRAD